MNPLTSLLMLLDGRGACGNDPRGVTTITVTANDSVIITLTLTRLLLFVLGVRTGLKIACILTFSLCWIYVIQFLLTMSSLS